jgi:hypothetical protein
MMKKINPNCVNDSCRFVEESIFVPMFNSYDIYDNYGKLISKRTNIISKKYKCLECKETFIKESIEEKGPINE